MRVPANVCYRSAVRCVCGCVGVKVPALGLTYVGLSEVHAQAERIRERERESEGDERQTVS